MVTKFKIFERYEWDVNQYLPRLEACSALCTFVFVHKNCTLPKLPKQKLSLNYLFHI